MPFYAQDSIFNSLAKQQDVPGRPASGFGTHYATLKAQFSRPCSDCFCLDVATNCIYTVATTFVWDEKKNGENIRKHGIDAMSYEKDQYYKRVAH